MILPPIPDLGSAQLEFAEQQSALLDGSRDARWLVMQWEQAREEVASSDRGLVLAAGEIQKVPDWSEMVKGLWDADRRPERHLHVILLGSAPLLIQQGLSESLAGRYEIVRLMHWSFAERPPRWFAWTLSNRPEIAADVLVRSVLAKLRKGAESPAGIHELAHSPDHARVARLATMPLLRQFPVRCASAQLSSLNHLLLAARRFCDIDPLLALIDEKRADHRMSVAQRVHWLVAGLCIAPESYVGRLESYAAAKERRIRFLAEAVTTQFGISPDLKCRRSAPALRLLIRLIGASCRPYSLGDESDEGVMVTPEMNAADRVRDCIEQLASIATEDASLALVELSSDNDLRPWRSLLMDAAYRQGAARREAEFTYSDTTRVLETLASGAPANVADLAALTLEHLNEIARTIRDSNTSDWKQYWNVDHHSRPQNPRPEDACRDALLSDPRNRLMRLGIEVQPEGRYANDKRADIRVSCAGFNIPVEIKRSCHRDLWSAVRSQLIARYSTDPGTEGHGIYLVLWFGHTERCRPTPPETGSPAVSSLELENRLVSTLSADERRKIGIRVIDVSIPSSS